MIIQPYGPSLIIPPPGYPSRQQRRLWTRSNGHPRVHVPGARVYEIGRHKWIIEAPFSIPVPDVIGWQAAVALGNTNTGSQTISSPASGAKTVNAGTNLCAFAPLAYDNAATMTVTAITYNSVAMTSCGAQSKQTGSLLYAQVFSLVAPSTGSNTFSCTISGTIQDIYFNIVAFTGVDQTTPVRAGSYFNESGAIVTDGSGNHAIVITSQVNDMSLTCVNGGPSNNVTSSKTRDGVSTAGTTSYAHDHGTGAATVTHTWSGAGSGQPTVGCGFSIAAAGAGATGGGPLINGGELTNGALIRGGRLAG